MVREEDLLVPGLEFEGDDGDLGLLRIGAILQEGQPSVVGGPLQFAEARTGSRFQQYARILAVGAHDPELMAVLGGAEGDPHAVGRDHGVVGVPANLAGHGRENGNDPDCLGLAGFARAIAAGDQFGSVPEPGKARSEETESRRQAQSVSLTGLQQAKVDSGRIGVGKVMAVG